MAKAGADLVGLNCLFDPFIMLDCMKIMKDAMDKEGLHPFLISQPLGYRDPDAGHFGWVDLPEFPYAIEPRYVGIQYGPLKVSYLAPLAKRRADTWRMLQVKPQKLLQTK